MFSRDHHKHENCIWQCPSALSSVAFRRRFVTLQKIYCAQNTNCWYSWSPHKLLKHSEEVICIRHWLDIRVWLQVYSNSEKITLKTCYFQKAIQVGLRKNVRIKNGKMSGKIKALFSSRSNLPLLRKW